MKLFSAEQIHRWDAYTIEHAPITSIDLMEKAAEKCFRWIDEKFSLDKIKKGFKIFCAKGNNSGDGLAIARMLIQYGYEVKIYILEFGHIGTIDFQTNLHRLHELTTEIHFIQQSEFFPLINKEDIVVDAILGSGLNRPLQGITADLVKHINTSAGCIISIDIPTGMFVDKSCKGETIIKADFTLTFQSLKLCFLMTENAAYFGEIDVLDIGLLPAFVENEKCAFEIISEFKIKKIYQPRNDFAHKGNFGHALIVAGSEGKMGAAVLCTRACVRTGSGLTSAFALKHNQIIFQMAVPEAMLCTDLDEKKFSAYAFGPGWSTAEEARVLLSSFLAKNSKENNSLVLDADALNILASETEWLNLLPANTIITPHPKEFERLFGKQENDFERMNIVVEKAKQFNIVIILKSHHTLIATPQGEIYFNSTGNAGMAKGGSGDVLTGMIVSLLAQNYSSNAAAILGVYLHGLAGYIAAQKYSKEAMTASDIIENIGEAFLKIEST